jgi:hypothetical protein
MRTAQRCMACQQRQIPRRRVRGWWQTCCHTPPPKKYDRCRVASTPWGGAALSTAADCGRLLSPRGHAPNTLGPRSDMFLPKRNQSRNGHSVVVNGAHRLISIAHGLDGTPGPTERRSGEGQLTTRGNPQRPWQGSIVKLYRTADADKHTCTRIWPNCGRMRHTAVVQIALSCRLPCVPQCYHDTMQIPR